MAWCGTSRKGKILSRRRQPPGLQNTKNDYYEIPFFPSTKTQITRKRWVAYYLTRLRSNFIRPPLSFCGTLFTVASTECRRYYLVRCKYPLLPAPLSRTVSQELFFFFLLFLNFISSFILPTLFIRIASLTW